MFGKHPLNIAANRNPIQCIHQSSVQYALHLIGFQSRRSTLQNRGLRFKSIYEHHHWTIEYWRYVASRFSSLSFRRSSSWVEEELRIQPISKSCTSCWWLCHALECDPLGKRKWPRVKRYSLSCPVWHAKFRWRRFCQLYAPPYVQMVMICSSKIIQSLSMRMKYQAWTLH